MKSNWQRTAKAPNSHLNTKEGVSDEYIKADVESLWKFCPYFAGEYIFSMLWKQDLFDFCSEWRPKGLDVDSTDFGSFGLLYLSDTC